MELHARNVRTLNDRGERGPVIGDCGRVAGEGSDVAVREVHLRAIRNPLENRGLAADGERVPADVRYLDRRRAFEPVTAARQEPKAGELRRLLASLEQPL